MIFNFDFYFLMSPLLKNAFTPLSQFPKSKSERNIFWFVCISAAQVCKPITHCMSYLLPAVESKLNRFIKLKMFF